MDKPPPTIDMYPDGRFRDAPRVPGVPLSMKLALGAGAVAVLGVSLAIAAMAIWVVSMVLPVIIIGGVVAWAMVKYRRWQLFRGQGGSVGRPPMWKPRQPGGFGQ